MAKNIKLGNNTLNGVTELKVQDATGGGALDSFVDTTDANAGSDDIVRGKTAYANGEKLTGLANFFSYSITTNVTNGTASGATRIYQDETGLTASAYVTIAPANGYILPSSVETDGAQHYYDNKTGVVSLHAATDNVVVTAICATQYTITTNVTNGTATGDTTITSDSTASVVIHVPAWYAAPDTISVIGASYTYDKATGIINLNSATSNVTINVVCEESQDIVDKGRIITMNLNGADKQYRVLKVSNAIAEVVSMSGAGSQKFAENNGYPYETSTLDTYLNSTWYNTLTSTAKAAIVDKTFRPDRWRDDEEGNPIYIGKYTHGTYHLSLDDDPYDNEITRHVYALSTQDVIDYLEVTPQMTQTNTTLTYDNIWKMFWNSTTTPPSSNIWLRSIDGFGSGQVFIVRSDAGILNLYDVFYSNTVRPAFQIDLSKIEWQ